MEKYEQITVVGEGSYGLVMKCKHKETDQIVAVKKFLETEEDATVRRMALREIRMLKKLRHENLVTMIEVFRHRKRFYLVFEFMEGSILDELEKYPEGLGDQRSRERIYQITRALQYCHANNVIHRDVKPENVLVSTKGVVKLCDFGFARLCGGQGDPYTDYVATRWYRSPELLVSDYYGAPIDVWAIGCIFAEMMTGEPLFPGDSDIDQLYLIVKLIGKPCSRHQQLMAKNIRLRCLKRTPVPETNALYKTFPTWSFLSLDFLNSCLRMDPNYRLTAEELLKHNYFLHDRFPDKFLPALKEIVHKEFGSNSLLRKFKSDLFLTPESKEDAKPRRSFQPEAPKWKIHFPQETVKRKFSSEVGSIENGSLVNLNQMTQKLSSLQKLGQLSKTNSVQLSMKQSSQGFLVPKLSNGLKDNSNPRLEKALDLLSKLNQKNRPKSITKDCNQPHSPPEFQSLQSHSFREVQKSPTVLHPSITNICFNKDPKKSPYLVQNLGNISLKSVFNQVPVTHPPKPFNLKRLERCVMVDGIGEKKTPPEWFVQPKREAWRGKNVDEFSLPTVPGATGSPDKFKKKQSPLHPADACSVHPAKILSPNSQTSTSSKHKTHLPFM